jgi:uncharacterized protein (TIGR03382 family)
VDIDGDMGPFSDWVSFSGDVGGCDGVALSGTPGTDADEEAGCTASPGTAAVGSWAFLVAAAAMWARRRSAGRRSLGETARAAST